MRKHNSRRILKERQTVFLARLAQDVADIAYLEAAVPDDILPGGFTQIGGHGKHSKPAGLGLRELKRDNKARRDGWSVAPSPVDGCPTREDMLFDHGPRWADMVARLDGDAALGWERGGTKPTA